MSPNFLSKMLDIPRSPNKDKPKPYPWTLSLLFLNGLQSYWSGSTSKINKFPLEHKFLSCILISNVYPIILSARLVQHFWTKCKIVILKKIFFLHFFTFGKISKSCILKLQSIQKRILVMDPLRWNTKTHSCLHCYHC